MVGTLGRRLPDRQPCVPFAYHPLTIFRPPSDKVVPWAAGSGTIQSEKEVQGSGAGFLYFRVVYCLTILCWAAFRAAFQFRRTVKVVK